MIVLDEQLQSKGLDGRIEKWHTGAVVIITTLRPGTIIKDEAIPALLAQQSQPCFVTINATDFWQHVSLSDKFCLVCFALTTADIVLIPDLLRRLFRHSDFDTKAKRAGKAVRITAQANASLYSVDDDTVRPLEGF